MEKNHFNAHSTSYHHQIESFSAATRAVLESQSVFWLYVHPRPHRNLALDIVVKRERI